MRLDAARGSNGFSINPLSYAEVEAFMRLRHLGPEPWEVEVLMRMDRVVMRYFAEKQAKRQEGPSGGRCSPDRR